MFTTLNNIRELKFYSILRSNTRFVTGSFESLELGLPKMEMCLDSKQK